MEANSSHEQFHRQQAGVGSKQTRMNTRPAHTTCVRQFAVKNNYRPDQTEQKRSDRRPFSQQTPWLKITWATNSNDNVHLVLLKCPIKVSQY